MASSKTKAPKMDVDNSRLRQSHLGEVAIYLHQLLKLYPEDAISAHLLSAVERQSLPPTVFAVWLSIARSPATLLQALTQVFSVATRRIAIKRVCKLLRRRRWQDNWEGLGGTEGVVRLLKKFSVLEVKLLLSRLPRFVIGPEKSGKQTKIEELFQRLLPSIYPGATLKGFSDERPLARHYQNLLPGCSSEFLDGVLRDSDSPLLRSGIFEKKANNSLLRDHYAILQQQCLEDPFNPPKSVINLNHYLPALVKGVPPLPSQKPGISESMEFSLLFLQKLASNPETNVHIESNTVLTGLIEPLLRRARKRKIEWTMIETILVLSIKYISSKVEEVKQLIFGEYRFLGICVKFWASSPIHRPDFEQQLVSILKLIRASQDSNVRDFEEAILWVPRRFRYKLLKLLFLHTGAAPIDLEDPKSLQERSPKNWPCNLFFSLQRDEAVGLLRRLRDTSARDDFLGRAVDSILTHPPSQELNNASSLMLLNLLDDSNPKMTERATASVEEQKKKSVTSREQEDRAFYAKSAVLFAISSGSLQLYSDTLIWTRRFVRDPLTAKILFSRGVMSTSEGLKLLSGIPDRLDGLKPSDIASRIRLSNQIVSDAFETACSALKEPSFFQPDWVASLCLMGQVTYTRLINGERLQEGLGLTDNQLYDLVFGDTLELSLRIEKAGLLPIYDRLLLRDPCFSLSGKYYHGNLPAGFRFIDNLAQARDNLWRECRPMEDPAAAALPPPLPRGLALQFLATASGFDVAVESAHGLTPYIMSRAEGVVFMRPDEAYLPIPELDDQKSATSVFVDDFGFALTVYVGQSNSPQLRETRIMQVWHHALKNLSARMDSEEAYRTWKYYFKRSLPNFQVPNLDPPMSMEYPVFPFEADLDEYNEWNPAEGFKPPPATQSRQLKPMTYLDCSLKTTQYHRGRAWCRLGEEYIRTVSFEPPNGDIWALDRLSRKQVTNPAIREGLIISALLFLENSIPNHKSVLIKPFPSAIDARYPSLWLDMSFPEVKGIGRVCDDTAFSVLQKFSFSVPPTLVYALTEASLKALFNAAPSTPHAEMAKLEQLAYGFLYLLAKSDRPALATTFLLKVVIEMPDSSSWHRKLLSLRLMRTLSAEQAQELIQAFTDAIEEKAKQPLSPSKEAAIVDSGMEKKVKNPHVKVTTIKYLAQLLQGADFVSEQFVIKILSTLFQSSSHIDVRVAIVQALIDMFVGRPDDPTDPLGNQILQILEATIPISGGLDERRQLTEKGWKEAERTGKLPEIFEQGNVSLDLTLPPILEVLLNSVGLRIKNSGDFKGIWKKRLVEDILLPILKLSIENNTRWLQIFVAKHGFDLQKLFLPPLPLKPRFLSELLHHYSDFIPASLFDLYSTFILANIWPPPQVADLHEKLREPGLSQSQEVKHWQSLYGHGPGIGNYNKLNLVQTLRWHLVSSGHKITYEQIQKHIFEQAKLLVTTNNLAEFEKFMGNFSPISDALYGDSRITITDWLRDAKPVLEHIISYIGSLRTPAWQRDLHRRPQTLPQTLKYRLLLLPFPTKDGNNAEAFAEGLRGFICEISSPGKAYHEEFPEIIGVVQRVIPERRAEVGCFLGTLPDENLELVDLLCVDLARHFFRSSQDGGALEEAKNVINSWKLSEVEGVRKKAAELVAGNGLFAEGKNPGTSRVSTEIRRQGTWGN